MFAPSQPHTVERADADVIVIGAGAAGLAAALFAGRSGARVLLLEGSGRVGTKIRASGGGRCNILPSAVDGDSFWSHSDSATMNAVLAALPLAQARALFETDLGLPLKTEATGKVFPRSDRADDVVQALLRGVAAAGVVLRTGAVVTDVVATPSDALGSAAAKATTGDDALFAGFSLLLASGETLRCRRVVLASGGLALPKSGSDGFGLRLALQLGHTVAQTYPALVPLTVDAPDLRALSGVAVAARLAIVDASGGVLAREAGDVLLTHRGLSGPAVLQASRHLTAPDAKGRRLRIHWGDVDWKAVLSDGHGGRQLGPALRAALPSRLANTLLARSGRADVDRLASLSKVDRKALLALLEGFEPVVTGSEGYKTAEVTGGGVRLDELDAKTLQSRVVPGLHLCGEVVDATGRLGGYNFLWAWASGKVAGLGAAAASERRSE